MQLYNVGKQKSFHQSFGWFGAILFIMGIIFLGVAIVIQLIPMSPEDMRVYVNGVQQPATEDTVHMFRMIFLLVFGFIGLLLFIIGGIVIGRNAGQRRLAKQLKQEGAKLTAQAVECTPSMIRVNRRMTARLVCSHTALNGQTYIFKSGLLRQNPYPYLQQGKVYVYHDRNNMSRYFVDVDESIGLGSRVIEL